MFIRGIGNAVKLAFVQIVRNRAMSFASLFSITAMLLVLGLFFILIVNVNMVTESAKKQFDTIQIYLAEETDRTDAQRMIQSLSGTKGVAKAWYLSKEEAMDEYRQKWGDKSYLLDGFQENPLPNSIRVKITDLELADSVVEAAKKLEGIEDIKYYRTAVDKLLAVTGYIKTGALAVIISLIAVSVVVVANTIKLTVLARAREISIMKYVGATNWYIRIPYIVEGALVGLTGALLAWALTWFAYEWIFNALMVGVRPNDVLAMVDPGQIARQIILVNLVIGIGVGALGSAISVRRHIAV